MTEPATQPEPQLPWCCTGRGYVSECPLCPEYGTSLLEPCPGHEASEANQTRVAEARLHAERRHPGYEYATTTGPRKQWDDPDRPPSDDRGDPDPSWEPNLDAGYPGAGWERFDYHEEAYWRRRKTPPQPADAPRSAVQAADGPAGARGAHDGAQAAQGDPLHAQIVAAVRPWLLGADEADVEHCAAEVVAAILPTTRLLGTLHRAAHDDINRVIDLYGRWVKAGPPPLGTPTARWWDQRLAELHDAVLPPGHDTGPSVAECAKADDEHWNTKYAGEGS